MARSNGFDSPTDGSDGAGSGDEAHTPGYTGRFIVAFEPGASEEAVALLANKAGVRARSAREASIEEATEENVVFEEIGAAVLSAEPDQERALVRAAEDSSVPLTRIEPERVVWVAMLNGSFDAPGTVARRGDTAAPAEGARSFAEAPPLHASGNISTEFLRGYAAAIQGLLAASGVEAESLSHAELAASATSLTWGLGATRVPSSPYSGRGIRVAVLDTGMDLHHPDFAGRTIVSRSFVGEPVQDAHGHGTHCIGTSCGPLNPPSGQRYGIAYNAEIYAGKVLRNSGSGADGGILAGINWAVQNRCAIVSMSLGSPVDAGEEHSSVYQSVARRAEERGTLIIAAAGNDSKRPGVVKPVSHPANCPSILAVAALDSSLRVAWFSDAGTNPDGGEVNIAGPGVDVFSSWPMPERYRSLNGTSMATPHVAGIAALYAEATGLRGMALANYLLRRSRRLSPLRDFGWGLVQAT
jgi:subtilisin family serine protease